MTPVFYQCFFRQLNIFKICYHHLINSRFKESGLNLAAPGDQPMLTDPLSKDETLQRGLDLPKLNQGLFCVSL